MHQLEPIFAPRFITAACPTWILAPLIAQLHLQRRDSRTVCILRQRPGVIYCRSGSPRFYPRRWIAAARHWTFGARHHGADRLARLPGRVEPVDVIS